MQERVRDGGGFGEVAAYSRAVRYGTHVAVSGTAPLEAGKVVHPGDSFLQARAAIQKALAAAAELGASHEDVVRTRRCLRRIATGKRPFARTQRRLPVSTRRTRRITSAA